MLTREELGQLAAVGLAIERQMTEHGPRWFIGFLGPYKTPEEALIAGVRWLVQHQSAPIQEDDDDEPPGPFRELLG